MSKMVAQKLSKKGNVLKLIVAIVVCQAAGGLGSLFTVSSIPTWYATLNKPSFSPPNFIFGPVWFTLFTLMGISLYLVWQQGIKKEEVKMAVILFGIHLIFNIFWSIIFFGLKSPSFAFLDILFLWCLIVAVTYKFWKLDTKAGLLLLPYLFWVSFAAVLNYNIWQLNR